MPIATQQHKPESQGSKPSWSISHPLWASYLLSLFPCLRSLCSGASGGGRGGGDDGELLTITVADPSSSARIQPACSKPCPSTWHCSNTSAPTSTEALDIWIFSVGSPGARGVLEPGEASKSCLGTLILPPPSPVTLPLPLNLQFLPALCPSPPFRARPPSPAQCPPPRGALFPSPSHHLQHLPQLALDMRARGPCPGHCSFCSRTPPRPSSSQRCSQSRAQEQCRGFPDRTLVGVGEERESGGRADVKEVLQQEGVQLDSGVDCLEVKEWGHGRSSSHGPLSRDIERNRMPKIKDSQLQAIQNCPTRAPQSGKPGEGSE